MKRNRLHYTLLFTALLFLCSGCTGLTSTPHQTTTPTPIAGGQLPKISLTSPTDDFIRTYLGLSKINSNTFSPTQIDCDILLIEIFSMYCPFCQRKAPNVNELFNLMQDDQQLSQQIKLIGIGVGNSAFEVGIFKDKYNVEFPLFADADFSIHNKLGQPRTPFFIALANRGEKKNQILLTKLGGFSSPGKFLRSITKLIEPPLEGEK